MNVIDHFVNADDVMMILKGGGDTLNYSINFYGFSNHNA